MRRERTSPAAEADYQEGNAGSGLRLEILSQGGCVGIGRPPVFVRSVEEARRTLVRIAGEVLEEQKPADPEPECFRFPPAGAREWEELVRCEDYRHYDPSAPDDGMEVSYALYRRGGLEGVGGLVWTYGVYLTVTGPPEVWDHPAHVPCGLDLFDD